MNKPDWLIDHVQKAWKLHSVWLAAALAFAGGVYATVQECWSALPPGTQSILIGLAPNWLKHWWPVFGFLAVVAVRLVKQPNAMPPQSPPAAPQSAPEMMERLSK